MMKRFLALCVVGTMALAACSSDNTPKPVRLSMPEPGQCLAKEAKDLDGLAPDYASVVNCKQPHVYELVDVLNVPAKFVATGPGEKRLERRSELAKSAATGSLAKNFHTYADRVCLGSILLATGLDGARPGQKWALDAGVRPVLLGARTLASVGPADRWATGKPSIVCSFRYTVPVGPTRPQGSVSPIHSDSSLPTYRELLSSDYPVALRACGSYDKDFYMFPILCTDQHNTEVLFSYDADLAFGKEFGDSVDGFDLTDAQWDRLVTPCSDALDDVYGGDTDQNLAGSVYLSDTWNTRGTHTAYCLITPDSDKMDLPAGSVVGHVGHVEVVPAKKADGLETKRQGA